MSVFSISYRHFDRFRAIQQFIHPFIFEPKSLQGVTVEASQNEMKNCGSVKLY